MVDELPPEPHELLRGVGIIESGTFRIDRSRIDRLLPCAECPDALIEQLGGSVGERGLDEAGQRLRFEVDRLSFVRIHQPTK